MLIEQLELHDFHVISANTDGIITQVPNDRFDEYKFICNEWSKTNRFDLEFTKYSKYVRLDVNDYLVIKDDGEVKYKGVLTPDFTLNKDKIEVPTWGFDASGNLKGYSMPIVARCLYEYYVNNINIDEYLHNYKNIYDFCISQRTGGQFVNESRYIRGDTLMIEPVQKNVRYYVSKRGVSLFKRDKVTNELTALVANKTVTLFNDYFEVSDFKDYNIDYNFYKSEIMNIINKVSNLLIKDIIGTKTGSKSGISGRMFNEL
jgi:hypothetical protein